MCKTEKYLIYTEQITFNRILSFNYYFRHLRFIYYVIFARKYKSLILKPLSFEYNTNTH